MQHHGEQLTNLSTPKQIWLSNTKGSHCSSQLECCHCERGISHTTHTHTASQCRHKLTPFWQYSLVMTRQTMSASKFSTLSLSPFPSLVGKSCSAHRLALFSAELVAICCNVVGVRFLSEQGCIKDGSFVSANNAKRKFHTPSGEDAVGLCQEAAWFSFVFELCSVQPELISNLNDVQMTSTSVLKLETAKFRDMNRDFGS